MKRSFRSPLPSQEVLKAYFDYHKDGFFIRKIGVSNSRAGTTVRGSKSASGHRHVSFQNQLFLVHRLVWVWHYGECANILDHINRNPSDNRIENLRVATRSLNHFNSKLSKNNTSGIRGLCFNKSQQAWVGQACITGKRISVSWSKDKDAAQQKLIEFQKQHHGEFYAGIASLEVE